MSKDDEYLAARSASAAQRANRIQDLKRKLAARDGNPAHKQNCQDIQTEITRLENISILAASGEEDA